MNQSEARFMTIYRVRLSRTLVYGYGAGSWTTV